MKAHDPWSGITLPRPAVDTDLALRRVHSRRRRRQNRNRLAIATGLAVILLVTVAVLAGESGDRPEGVVADTGPDRSTVATEAPRPQSTALWQVDPSQAPDPAATSFVALVTRLGCNDGVTEEVSAPEVEIRSEWILVTFTFAPISAPHTCPENEQVPYEVEVGEPIGDRLLRDGGCPVGPSAPGAWGCVVVQGDEAGSWSDVRWPEGAAMAPHRCEARAGGALDVAHEPEGRNASFADVTDVDGCLVRIDHLAERISSDDCALQTARVLVTGETFGADSASYVRDPEGVFGDQALAAAFRADVELPVSTGFSGYFADGHAVWVDPSNASAVWVVTPDSTVEKWPRAVVPDCP